MLEYYENVSSGPVIIHIATDNAYCHSWLLLPGGNFWPLWIRTAVYVLALLYLFVGIAVSSDVFMYSIERITAKKRKIIIYDEELGKTVEDEEFIWNETVANLTLMALGSSAPEILLACIEAVKGLSEDSHEVHSSLGLFTIIGSATFNLLVISGICIVSITSPTVKKIAKFSVFMFTSFCSLFAYVWMLLVVAYISPEVVEIWESLLTLSFFPIMVIFAYAQDNEWWLKKFFKVKRSGNLPQKPEKNPEQQMTDNRSFEHSADVTTIQSENTENRRKIQPSEFRLRMERRSSESVIRRKLMSEQRRTFSRGSLFR
ncbi:unnamed protein product [Trichobilharzia szidati]|nr:unnamed protein product [Trichobilharzia szidati]